MGTVSFKWEAARRQHAAQDDAARDQGIARRSGLGQVHHGSIAQRGNILVTVAASTGKTTLVNGLLVEVAGTAVRAVVIEDTRELQCNALNLSRCAPGTASFEDTILTRFRVSPSK